MSFMAKESFRRIRDQFPRHQTWWITGLIHATKVGEMMHRLLSGLSSATVHFLTRGFAVSCLTAVIGLGSINAGFAQQDQAKQPAGNQGPSPADIARDSQRKSDEFVEAANAINGPAGNPECVWLGRRVVVLMWRDDLDTAFRHLDLYDRFGCPGGHVQATFRCLVKFGAIDPKQPDSLNSRVHACWINPNAQPQQASGQPAQPAATPAAGTATPQAPATPPAPAEQK
jgi:hypothetical protein